jgi:hypothetical protein
MDFIAQLMRVAIVGTGRLYHNIKTVHEKVQRPLVFHLVLIAFGAFLGFIALQDMGLTVAGLVTGPIVLYGLLLGGFWLRSVVLAARSLGRESRSSP